MASGRDMRLTRQVGEHLVASELGRMGYVAAPFAGNVPMFDILAADIRGHAIPVQVKAIKGASWQFRADTFLKVDVTDDGEQIVRGKTKLPNPDLLCIFVLLKDNEGDEFFIYQLRDLQAHFLRTYKGGRRPRNPESMHCAIWPKDWGAFRDNWPLVAKQFPA